MGLDVVEIVMTVEERFKVSLPDSECARAVTVADLAALVIRRMKKPVGICSTARTFYRLRRLLTEQCAVERPRVHPHARLEHLLPSRVKRNWQALRAVDSTIPALEAPTLIDCIFLLLSAIGICSLLPIGVGLGAAWGLLPGIGGVAVLAVVGAICLSFGRQAFVCQIPNGLVTVGDLVLEIAPSEPLATRNGAHLIAQLDILNEVREIVSHYLGLPLEKVRADSSFVDDLGC